MKVKKTVLIILTIFCFHNPVLPMQDNGLTSTQISQITEQVDALFQSMNYKLHQIILNNDKNKNKILKIEDLLQKGANIEALNELGFTPLLAAFFTGNLSLIKLFIEKYHANINITFNGKNLIELIAEEIEKCKDKINNPKINDIQKNNIKNLLIQFLEIQKYLNNFIKVCKFEDQDQNNSIISIANTEDQEVLNNRLLHVVQNEDLDEKQMFIKANKLISRGAKVHLFIQSQEYDEQLQYILHAVAFLGFESVIDLFLINGADMNVQNFMGDNLLHILLDSEKIISSELLNKIMIGYYGVKPDLTITNNEDYTPLYSHILGFNPDLNVVKILIKNGAKFDLSVKDKNIIELLDEKISNSEYSKIAKNQVNKLYEIKKYISKLLNKNSQNVTSKSLASDSTSSDTSNINNPWDSKLIEACTNGDCNTVILALKNRANINKRSIQGYTPIGLSVFLDHIKITKELLKYKLFIDLDAPEINQNSINHGNVLNMAVKDNKSFEVLKMLFDAGYSVNTSDALGNTAFFNAVLFLNVNAVNLFLPKVDFNIKNNKGMHILDFIKFLINDYIKAIKSLDEPLGNDENSILNANEENKAYKSIYSQKIQDLMKIKNIILKFKN